MRPSYLTIACSPSHLEPTVFRHLVCDAWWSVHMAAFWVQLSRHVCHCQSSPGSIDELLWTAPSQAGCWLSDQLTADSCRAPSTPATKSKQHRCFLHCCNIATCIRLVETNYIFRVLLRDTWRMKWRQCSTLTTLSITRLFRQQLVAEKWGRPCNVFILPNCWICLHGVLG